jgi:23S rRNA (cytidine1920-2'-O)/16S rRNA (cytidine1409-2'-O)-methyltransferase
LVAVAVAASFARMARRRLDTVLTERGLAPSRSAAATSIRAGLVRIGAGGERAAKPGQLVDEQLPIEVETGRTYVSRGGLKLEAALDRLGVEVDGRLCLDVGASTGGFTDCLLRRGAAAVVAVDVGRGQLEWGLRNDPRVTVLEGVNARGIEAGDLPFAPDLVTIDVSFISLAKVLAPLPALVAAEAEVLAMVKPQFELGRARVGKGGVVRDPADRADAVIDVAAAAGRLGLATKGVAAAGVAGPKGNREVFLLLGGGDPLPELADLVAGEVG